MCHAIDTAAVAKQIFSLLLGPQCRAELREAFLPLGDAEGWIALLCGLHDLGKYSPTFQSLNIDLAEDRLGTWASSDLQAVRRPSGIPRIDTPHGLVTALHMREWLGAMGATRGTAREIADALGGHHGYFPSAGEVQQALNMLNNHGRKTWATWRDGMVGDLIRLRGLPDPRTLPWAEVRVGIGAAVSLAALTTISDWIASDEANFASPPSEIDLVDYMPQAADLATAAVKRLDWEPWRPPADTSFVGLFPGASPRPVQHIVAQLTAGLAEPILLVVEAPTGEGKTKAALQAVSTLVRDLGLAGTYVAMPTQATSNQMLAVVQQMLQDQGDGTTVRLLHSSAGEYLAEKAGGAGSTTTAPTDVGTDDPGDSYVAAQEWFTRKKNLLGVLGVGTVDQALKAAIRSGHMFVRLAALSNKVVVIDEVHAYDTYMSTLLDRLLAWLGRLGVSVVVLSATLPSRRRQDLVAAWQSGLQRCHQTDAPSMPASSAYPRVTRAGSGVPVVRAAEASDLNANRVVRLERVADDGIVEWLLAQAEGGRCVAVVHNLVRRAIATHESLKSRIAELPEGERPRLIAITGQLAVTQRRAVEAELRAGFGPGGSRPRAIVVGTQVLEQSLDLDFDVMLTDLAPIDSMIQRAGRVHRHDRSPARGVPVLAISGVTDGPTGPAFPPYLGHVYAPMVLLRTWALLRGEKELRCPEQVPTLVDAVYGSAQAVHCPSGWEKAWQKAADQLDRALDKHNRDARTVYPPHPEAVTHLSELTARGKSTRRTRRESHRS